MSSVKVLSDEEIDAMTERELCHLIWDYFGVAVDYASDRKDILKVLRRLSS